MNFMGRQIWEIERFCFEILSMDQLGLHTGVFYGFWSGWSI